jgi:hypothetical protein
MPSVLSPEEDTYDEEAFRIDEISHLTLPLALKTDCTAGKYFEEYKELAKNTRESRISSSKKASHQYREITLGSHQKVERQRSTQSDKPPMQKKGQKTSD